jgi:hypothetical protein
MAFGQRIAQASIVTILQRFPASVPRAVRNEVSASERDADDPGARTSRPLVDVSLPAAMSLTDRASAILSGLLLSGRDAVIPGRAFCPFVLDCTIDDRLNPACE